MEFNSAMYTNKVKYNKIDGCGMGNPLLPVIANIFMSKFEHDVVTPRAPLFYDWYVDDIF